MKAPAYKILCKTNPDAVGLANHLEGEYDMPPDTREGNILYFSKEWWDYQNIDQNDILHYVEDWAMVYEADYTPEIEVVEYDFDGFEDKYEGFGLDSLKK